MTPEPIQSATTSNSSTSVSVLASTSPTIMSSMNDPSTALLNLKGDNSAVNASLQLSPVSGSNVESIIFFCQDLQGRIIMALAYQRLMAFLAQFNANAMRLRLKSVKEDHEYPVCLHEAHKKLHGGSKEWYAEHGCIVRPIMTEKKTSEGDPLMTVEIHNRATWLVEYETEEESLITFQKMTEKLTDADKKILEAWRERLHHTDVNHNETNNPTHTMVMLFVLRSRQLDNVEKQLARLLIEALDEPGPRDTYPVLPAVTKTSWTWPRCQFKIFSNTRRSRNVIMPRGKRQAKEPPEVIFGASVINILANNNNSRPNEKGSGKKRKKESKAQQQQSEVPQYTVPYGVDQKQQMQMIEHTKSPHHQSQMQGSPQMQQQSQQQMNSPQNQQQILMLMLQYQQLINQQQQNNPSSLSIPQMPSNSGLSPIQLAPIHGMAKQSPPPKQSAQQSVPPQYSHEGFSQPHYMSGGSDMQSQQLFSNFNNPLQQMPQMPQYQIPSYAPLMPQQLPQIQRQQNDSLRSMGESHNMQLSLEQQQQLSQLQQSKQQQSFAFH